MLRNSASINLTSNTFCLCCSPNTYRVMSTDAEKLPQVRPQVKPSSFDMPTVNLIGQPITTEQALESRHNRPNPMHVSFLQGNVKCMNDPVCHVQTAPLQKYEHDWWPSRTSNEPLHSPQYSLDSFYRREYHPKKHVHGFSRHESNPNKLPAQGIGWFNYDNLYTNDVHTHCVSLTLSCVLHGLT